MKKSLLVFIFTMPVQLFAQYDWVECVIKDEDGFTFVRSGPGQEYKVIDTVFKNSFFYAYTDSSTGWMQVQVPNAKTGYMHKSRVQSFFKLDSLMQHFLVQDAFNEIILAYKNNDRVYRNQVYEAKYLPGYTVFGEMFCHKPDTSLLCLFFRTLPYLSGSADEGTAWVSAEMWLCRPAEVKMAVCALTKEEQKCSIAEIKMGMAMSGKENDYTPKKLKEMYAELDKTCE